MMGAASGLFSATRKILVASIKDVKMFFEYPHLLVRVFFAIFHNFCGKPCGWHIRTALNTAIWRAG